jgi:protein-arginine kinase activator protein McsA
MQCDNCKRPQSRLQLARLLWQKTGKYIDLCPKCYKEQYQKEINKIVVSKETEDMFKKADFSGGYTTQDIKEFLKKWNKEHYETF